MSVGRLAPSPTGRLHLGHARSFLLAWWQARSSGGRLLMRMEDLDTGRSRPEFEHEILRDLEWLGLDWDGAIVRQSERRELYAAALEHLQCEGRLYPCICTRREIELAVAAPHSGDTARAYPGTCRGSFESMEVAQRVSGRAPALRFRVPAGQVEFLDGIQGPQSWDVAGEVGDFPVQTRDGSPAYQLAVVVDDDEQGVTEVLRGDDLLASTARQRLLQSALKIDPPRWFHLPLVVDAHGRRLAKRSDDLSLGHLRERGVEAQHIVAWAARSAGVQVGPAIDADEVLPTFDLDRLPRSPLRLSADPLNDLRTDTPRGAGS